MVLLGIELKKDDISSLYFNELRNKLKSNNINDSPFIGNIKEFCIKNKYFILTDLKPYVHPVFFISGASTLLFLITGFRFSWWDIILIPFILAMFICSRLGLYLFFVLGLKKKKYSYKIKLLSNNEIIKRLSVWEK